MRNGLEPYRNKRIKIRGIFDKCCIAHRRHDDVLCALLQEIQNAETLEPLADHCYVQNAENIQVADPKRGETVECLVTVMDYKKRLKDARDAETDFGLYLPAKVYLPERQEASDDRQKQTHTVEEVVVPPVVNSLDAIEAMKQLKSLGKVFGYDKLTEMIETLR